MYQVKVNPDGAIQEPLDGYITSYMNDDENKPLLYFRIEGLKQNTHFQVFAKLHLLYINLHTYICTY